MRTLSNVELLDVWEAGLSQTVVERALALVAAAEPDVPVDELARLSVGQRDLRLFLLRKATFGGALPVTASCPSCGEQAEASVDVDELMVTPDVIPKRSEGPGRAGGAQLEPQALMPPEPPGPSTDARDDIEVDGYRVRFRLPNSIDLAAVANEPSTEAAALRLLAACIDDAQTLPDNVITAVAERMAELDPQADIELALTCPACGTPWTAALDIVSFFWSEIHAWAQRTMQDVHVLASAYGWSEHDILRMSARRRRTYLDMIAG